jgi:hypothetical protein
VLDYAVIFGNWVEELWKLCKSVPEAFVLGPFMQGLNDPVHHKYFVRCLIMQSFLGIGWKNYGNYAKSVPEAFVLGPFMQGLNDPVHHKDFGLFST